jgi:hypothetical protein
MEVNFPRHRLDAEAPKPQIGPIPSRQRAPIAGSRKFFRKLLAQSRLLAMGMGSLSRGALLSPRENRLDDQPRLQAAEDCIFSPGSTYAA